MGISDSHHAADRIENGTGRRGTFRGERNRNPNYGVKFKSPVLPGIFGLIAVSSAVAFDISVAATIRRITHDVRDY